MSMRTHASQRLPVLRNVSLGPEFLRADEERVVGQKEVQIRLHPRVLRDQLALQMAFLVLSVVCTPSSSPSSNDVSKTDNILLRLENNWPERD